MPRVQVRQPQTPTRRVVKHLARTNIRPQVGSHVRISRRSRVLIRVHYEEPTVCGLRPVVHLRQRGRQRPIPLGHQEVRAVEQIAIDVLGRRSCGDASRRCIGVHHRSGSSAAAAIKPDDHAVHDSSVWSLGCPRERAMGEPDAPTGLEDRPKNAVSLVSLGDRVGGDECEATRNLAVVVNRLLVPTCDVIHPAGARKSPHSPQFG
ncbi:Uncharacterised protein [Mycobacteroides abscessus subsp. abscessus]|nr:Uncharacterised protein [Mycobacteroides abscessus subsp. abscessus]